MNHVEGVREEGDLTNENKRFPDTYYYYSFEPEYDKVNQEIRFSSEMVADKGEYCEDGFPVYHENAYVRVEYDIINESISVKAESEYCYDYESDEDAEYMKEVLFNLECRIGEDEEFMELLKKETSHLRPKKEFKKTEENPNLIWDGTKSCICDFTLEVNNWGYQYLVKCIPLFDDLQDDLGAACWSEEKLIQQTLEFTEAGYAFQVQKIDDNYIDEVKNSVCVADR
ncbi:MAG: hypothetical protein N4A35_15205 [Flavobacteriales bacterium]|nr:hypothetical protein [Flavobacteriales bacterium]